MPFAVFSAVPNFPSAPSKAVISCTWLSIFLPVFYYFFLFLLNVCLCMCVEGWCTHLSMSMQVWAYLWVYWHLHIQGPPQRLLVSFPIEPPSCLEPCFFVDLTAHLRVLTMGRLACELPGFAISDPKCWGVRDSLAFLWVWGHPCQVVTYRAQGLASTFTHLTQFPSSSSCSFSSLLIRIPLLVLTFPQRQLFH